MNTAAPIRVLALSPLPIEGAGCRFRIAQFIPYLNDHGFQVDLHTLYTREFFNLVYKRVPLRDKARAFAPLMRDHLWSLRHLRSYDVVFIYREMFPVGPALVEWLMSLPGCPPIVFDFDDAIYLPSVSAANQRIQKFKRNKVPTIVRRSSQVVVGNEFLATYARQFNQAVEVIPTCVNTDEFTPLTAPPAPAVDRPLVLGWIGSPTTAEYIEGLAPVLQTLARQHQFVLRVSGAEEVVAIPGITVENPPWTLSGEVDLFRTCDIGVYPLANDEWAKGKCGFKAIAFMACGVPVVASAVGANCEIIEDGVNGFLARTPDEFVDRLSRLIADAGLRRRLAAAGRQTIEERYSLHVNAPRLAAVLRRAAGRDA